LKWPKDFKRAKRLQEELEKRVRVAPLRRKFTLVAGVDCAFFTDRIIGAACLYRYPELTLIDKSYKIKKSSFPYVPGYLSFREGPVIIEAIRGLKVKPDLCLFDGQGIAHPRGLGIASHIGVVLGIPSIGCAKSRLVGEYKEPGQKKGDNTPLIYDGKAVGVVLRTRDNVRPLFVSPGHMVDIKGAVQIVSRCLGKYRIPEPLRCADLLTKKIKRGSGASLLR
jgi:deoxyribonuclease V